MKLSRSPLIKSCLMVSCLLSCSWLNAQDEKTRRSDTRIKEGDQISSVGIITPQENDRRIVRWLMIDQRAVVDCSKIAQEHSTNESVKTFAQQMVSEHNSCLDKMESYRKEHSKSATGADHNGNPPITTTDKAHVDLKKSGVLVRDEDGHQREGKMVYHATDFVQVKEDICNQIKAAMAKEMKALPGSEFDRAYMKHMVASHEMILASCKAVRKTASSDLQAMLDQNIEKLNTHLKAAKQLCDQVCGTTTTGSLRK